MMGHMMKKAWILGGLLAVTSISADAALVFPTPPQTTASSKIVRMTGGWGDAMLYVVLSVPVINPANCSNTDGYMTNTADPGAPLYNQMLLNAYQSGQKISLVISANGCTPSSRPQIVGVNFDTTF